jgi:hypothetical protein
MLAANDKQTLLLLRKTKYYLECVDISGIEAVDVAECIAFLEAWIAVSSHTPDNIKYQDKLQRRRERYRQKKAETKPEQDQV